MTKFEATIIEAYPQINRSDVKLLWHRDFWDGPLSGMLRFGGENCWYEMIVENEIDDDEWYRRFAVVRLTPDQIADENYWHDKARISTEKYSVQMQCVSYVPHAVATHTDGYSDLRAAKGLIKAGPSRLP